MKKIGLCLLCVATALASCTTTKFKSASSTLASEELAADMDANFSESGLRRSSGETRSSYDAIWWLKGKVRLHPDSGLVADEAFIRFQGDAVLQQQLLDSVTYGSTQRVKRETSLKAKATANGKEKEKLFKLPWWGYILLLMLGTALFWRWIKR